MKKKMKSEISKKKIKKTFHMNLAPGSQSLSSHIVQNSFHIYK